jgi:hypothetical protein
MADSPTIDCMRSDFGFAGQVDVDSLKAAALWLRQGGARVGSGRTRVRTLADYKVRKASRRKRNRSEALGEAHGTQLGSTNEADLMLTMDVGCDTPIVAYDIGCGGGRIIESMCLALHHHDRVIGFDCFGIVAAVPHAALPLALRQGYASTYTISGCSASADCGVFRLVPDPSICDGTPTYQNADGTRVLYRFEDGHHTQWVVGSKDVLKDALCFGWNTYSYSALNDGRLGSAPTAPGYSAGSGWCDANNDQCGSIHVTAGGGH